MNTHIEHRIQLWEGGLDVLSNFRLTHPTCNLTRRKGPEKAKVEVARSETCLRCGSPVPPPSRLYCSDRCSNVMKVRRYRERNG